MIDLILCSFVIAVFCGGFWCGKAFGSMRAMFSRATASVANWFK